MTTTISLDMIYKNLPDALKDVFAGKTVIVEDKTKPIFKIEPLNMEKKLPLRAGSAKGKFTMPEDFTETPEDFKEYM